MIWKLKALGVGNSSRQGAKSLTSEEKDSRAKHVLNLTEVTPSQPSETRCHFDRREKSFFDPSHSLGMTGGGPSPLRLGVFAGDHPAFGCGVAALYLCGE